MRKTLSPNPSLPKNMPLWTRLALFVMFLNAVIGVVTLDWAYFLISLAGLMAWVTVLMGNRLIERQAHLVTALSRENDRLARIVSLQGNLLRTAAQAKATVSNTNTSIK